MWRPLLAAALIHACGDGDTLTLQGGGGAFVVAPRANTGAGSTAEAERAQPRTTAISLIYQEGLAPRQGDATRTPVLCQESLALRCDRCATAGSVESLQGLAPLAVTLAPVRGTSVRAAAVRGAIRETVRSREGRVDERGCCRTGCHGGDSLVRLVGRGSGAIPGAGAPLCPEKEPGPTSSARLEQRQPADKE